VNIIGSITSCYKEKFGIPRQPGLVPEAQAVLSIHPPYDEDEAFAGLSQFSHIWIVFLFHGTEPGKWSPTVRPPRLGGNQRLGVFATRSPFRPNPIGLSVVELVSIDRHKGRLQLNLKGGDFLDGTPVLDIKPYIPYADVRVQARAGYASSSPDVQLNVEFLQAAKDYCESRKDVDLTTLVSQVLACDPRPAYCVENPKRTDFAMRLLNVDVKWRHRNDAIIVTDIIEVLGN